MRSEPRIIAVAGGKGGTGKSLLAANIGIFLATLNKRVVVVDAAFGAANLHAFVGVDRPGRTLADMLGKSGATLAEVVVPTPVPGLGLVAGESDPAWAANPKAAQLTRFAHRARELDADYVVLDLAAGTGVAVLDLFIGADVPVLVVVPEPTAVELGYRLLKAAFLRRLHRANLGAADFTADEMRHCEGGLPAPIDLHARAAAADPARAARLLDEMTALRPRLVVNHVRSKSDMELGRAIAPVARRRLGLPVDYLGHLEHDEAVWVAVRRRRPLLIEHPESRIAKCFEKVVRRLLAREHDRSVPEVPASDSFYDLIDVDPTASEEEIRRANRRVREIYARDSIVIGGLYGKERLDEIHVKIDEAYETLMDAGRRKDYDRELFPDGIPARGGRGALGKEITQPTAIGPLLEPAPVPAETVDPGSAPTDPPVKPPAPQLGPDTIYSGPLLRQVREARGLELREISERTKIGIGYLTALEGEDWKKLPAVVYVRGFLSEYAKRLGLDVGRVLATYLARYRTARAQLDLEEAG